MNPINNLADALCEISWLSKKVHDLETQFLDLLNFVLKKFSESESETNQTIFPQKNSLKRKSHLWDNLDEPCEKFIKLETHHQEPFDVNNKWELK